MGVRNIDLGNSGLECMSAELDALLAFDVQNFQPFITKIVKTF